MREVSDNNLVGIQSIFKIGASICIILFPANCNYEITVKLINDEVNYNLNKIITSTMDS
jgi:hypothetical protein